MISQPLDLNIPGECPACGLGGCVVTFGSDRYGNDCIMVHCPHCGVAYWRNAKNKEWYHDYYASGKYREDVSKYHGRDVMATIEKEQADYARRLSQKIHPRPHTHLLDIGGSTGVVSNAFRQVFNVSATVMDPAKEFSAPKEVKHIQASAEDYRNEHGFKWDTILICQTVDHLLDPIGVLRNCREWLTDDGVLFVDILDVEQEIRQKGWQHTRKICHPWAWTEKGFRQVLANSGFVLAEPPWETAPHHIGFLCE